MNGRTALHLALIASLTACAYPLTALLCVWDGKPAGLSAWGMAGLLALLLWLGLGGILLVRRTYYRHPRWVNSALWTLSALAGVGAAFLAPLDTVFFRILLGAAAAGAFFGGTRLLFLPPETLAELAEETPLGRNGTPEDVAEAVRFLASDRAAFITGQDLPVNGGFLCV